MYLHPLRYNVTVTMPWDYDMSSMRTLTLDSVVIYGLLLSDVHTCTFFKELSPRC